MRRRELYVPSERHVAVADGLRALFIFIIGWYHIWQQSWLSPYANIGSFRINVEPLVRTGYIWVDGMLLLSGFLSFLPCARSMHDGTPLPDAKSFYWRRVARILPAYLFCIFVVLCFDALPSHAYTQQKYLWLDLISHLTFTQTFFNYSYFYTHLNVVLWTLAVEVQFYLIFPLLARAFARRPAVTWIGMVAAAWIYRGCVAAFVTENNIWINQLIAFMDIYALGFLCAWMYVSLARTLKPSAALQILSTAMCVVICIALWQLVRRQMGSVGNGYEAVRAMQMRNRFALGALLSMLLLCATWSLDALRGLLSCRPMRFLAGISFQFYIWHQYLAVKLRDWGIPYSVYESPNRESDKIWQWQYTLLCFGLALAVAIAVTYLIERPIQRLMLRWRRG